MVKFRILELFSVKYFTYPVVSSDQSSFAFFYVDFESIYRCVNDVLKAGKSSSSLLDTCRLSTSCLRCKVLCMVVSFVIFWPICLISSLSYFKNGPKYLTRWAPQLFILFIRFLLYNLVLNSFLVLLENSFCIFSFTSSCLIVSASIYLSIFTFLLRAF